MGVMCPFGRKYGQTERNPDPKVTRFPALFGLLAIILGRINST